MSAGSILRLRSFGRCSGGAAAVEFGLLAPLLLLMLAVGVDVGRGFQAHREFETAVTGVARLLGSLPEYDSRARTYALPIAKALLPPDAGNLAPGAGGRFNLKVRSLQKTGGAMTEVFAPDTLFGVNPNLPASTLVAASKFDETESVIELTASYQFVPLMMPASLGMTMKKTYVVIPYFSRRYVRVEGPSADTYVY